MDRKTLALGLGGLLLVSAAACGGARADNDFPPRKPGLWQVSLTMPGGPMPPQQMKMCIDTKTDREMQQMGMKASQGMCDKPNLNRSGSTVTIDSVCKMGPTKAATHVVTNFTGDTSYHSDITTHFDPPMAGQAQQVMAQDGKWSGPCPADMMPGDVVMGNGMKMNIKQMMGPAPQR